MAIGSSEIDILTAFDFQKANMWDFSIISSPAGNVLNNIANILETVDIKFKIKSVTLPFEKLKLETRPTGEKFYTDFEPIEEFSMDIYETTTFSTYRYFESWKESIYSRFTRTFNLSTPDRIGILRYFAYDQITPTQIFIYEGLKFVGIDQVENSYDTGDPLAYTVTMSCDQIYSMIP